MLYAYIPITTNSQYVCVPYTTLLHERNKFDWRYQSRSCLWTSVFSLSQHTRSWWRQTDNRRYIHSRPWFRGSDARCLVPLHSFAISCLRTHTHLFFFLRYYYLSGKSSHNSVQYTTSSQTQKIHSCGNKYLFTLPRLLCGSLTALHPGTWLTSAHIPSAGPVANVARPLDFRQGVCVCYTHAYIIYIYIIFFLMRD